MRWQFFKTKDEGRRTKEIGSSSDLRLSSDIRCPLCGKSFRAEDAAACAACALAKCCGLVMCPNCGYEFAA